MSNVFDEAIKKVEETKDREDRKRAGGFDFEDVKKMALHYGDSKTPRTEKVFRIYGNPLEMRKEVTDPKLIFFSQVVKDGGESFTNIIWKTFINDIGVPEVDEDWILHRLYKKVTEGTWRPLTDDEKKVRSDNKRSEKLFKHIGTMSFARVNSNRRNKDKDAKFTNPFAPKKRVLLNVIDRMDNWCVENKHAKVLMASISPFEFTDEKTGKKTIIEYNNNLGIPYLAYTLFFENVVKFHHGWDIDIVAKATGELSHSYEIRDITENKISDLSKKVGKDTPMTPEELVYELYDLDKLYRETTYTKLYKNLIGLFKQVDAEFSGEHFTEELTHLYNEEAQKLLEEKKRRESSETPSEEPSKETPVSEGRTQESPVSSKPEAPSERKARVAPAPEPNKSAVNYTKAFPYWNDILEADRDDIIANLDHLEDTVPVWKNNDILGCDDDSCCFVGTKIKTTIPNAIEICPVCGLRFKKA